MLCSPDPFFPTHTQKEKKQSGCTRLSQITKAISLAPSATSQKVCEGVVTKNWTPWFKYIEKFGPPGTKMFEIYGPPLKYFIPLQNSLLTPFALIQRESS